MSEESLERDKLIDYDDAIKPHEITLQHAIEISALVKERTIGPDLPEPQDEEEKLTTSTHKQITPKKPKTPQHQEITTKLIIPLIKPSPSLDYELISATFLLRDAEEKRKKQVRQHVNDMQERQLAVLRDNAARQREQQNKLVATRIAEKQRNDALIIQEAEKQTAIELEECERLMAAMRLNAKRQLEVFSFQCVAKYHTVFIIKYEGVNNTLLAIEKQAFTTCIDYNSQCTELVEQFDHLTNRIKIDDCNAGDVKTANCLCNKMEDLHNTINEEFVKMLKQREEAQLEEQRKAEEQQALAAAALAAQLAQTPAEPTTPTRTEHTQPLPVQEQIIDTQQITVTPQTPPTQQRQQPQQVTPQTPKTTRVTQPTVPTIQEPAAALAFYQEIYSFYQEKVESVKPLQTDENMKKYRFACQKAINIPLNAISAVSPQHLQDKFERIFNFLNGQPHKTTDGQVSVNDHPLGRNYCLLLTAKRFVNQGETAISSNPQAAFPVASVVVSLWKLIPEFGKLFLAYIFKDSPFLVPLRGKSVEEYNDLKRQAGITRLYAAVMITSGRRAEGPEHPYGLEHAWRWLTNFTSLEPLPDISATLILEMLQTLGFNMCRAYGKQFTKLLIYMQREYFAKLAQVDEGGPRTRLEMLFMNYLNQNQIPEPQGTLPPAFW